MEAGEHLAPDQNNRIRNNFAVSMCSVRSVRTVLAARAPRGRHRYRGVPRLGAGTGESFGTGLVPGSPSARGRGRASLGRGRSSVDVRRRAVRPPASPELPVPRAEAEVPACPGLPRKCVLQPGSAGVPRPGLGELPASLPHACLVRCFHVFSAPGRRVCAGRATCVLERGRRVRGAPGDWERGSARRASEDVPAGRAGSAVNRVCTAAIPAGGEGRVLRLEARRCRQVWPRTGFCGALALGAAGAFSLVRLFTEKPAGGKSRRPTAPPRRRGGP